MNCDLEFIDHGSVWLLRGITPAGRAWLDEYVESPDNYHWGGALVVEPRYVFDIVAGAEMDGLRVTT